MQKDEEILIDKIENEDEKEEDDDIEGKKKKSNQIDEEIKKIKEFRDNSSDKIITELFLQNFIVKNCDILLLVVGKLTYSEQKLIIKIKDECKKQNRSRLFIVHNLQEFRKVDQVQNYIKDTLLNCSTFNLKIRQNITTQKTNDEIKINNSKTYKINEILGEDNLNKNGDEIIIDIKNNDKLKDIELDNALKSKNFYLTENINYIDGKKLEVFHLILANENSEAGEVYNTYAYQFIENIYNLITEQKTFDIFEQVKNNFKNIYDLFIANDLKKAQFNSIKNIKKKQNNKIRI